MIAVEIEGSFNTHWFELILILILFLWIQIVYE